MTSEYDPVSLPVALTVAGSDSGGGAGVQADLRTVTHHDVFGTSVVTATTAQNTRGVHDVHPLPVDHVAAQLDAVVDDFDVAAAKTGMLATAELVETVTRGLADFAGSVVVDPVMVAATGDRLLSPDAEAAYADLVAEATLVTPNADEAAVLTDGPVETPADAVDAGRELVDAGADAALIKGGHLDGDPVIDTLVIRADGSDAARAPAGGDDVDVDRFETARLETDATHGSGCVLSSAITARLARGESLREAVAAAVDGMSEAIRRGYDVGEGSGAVNPTRLNRRADGKE